MACCSLPPVVTMARSLELLLFVVGLAMFTTDVASFEPRVTCLD